jgi:hypothetical protein
MLALLRVVEEALMLLILVVSRLLLLVSLLVLTSKGVRVRARWGGSWIPRLVLGLLLLLVVPSWFPVAGEYLLP